MNNEEILPGFDEEVCGYLTIRFQKIGENALSVEHTGNIDAYDWINPLLRAGLDGRVGKSAKRQNPS
jgi:hypothetical protein